MYCQVSNQSSDTLESRTSDTSTAQLRSSFRPSSLLLWACITISISSSFTALSLLLYDQNSISTTATTEGYALGDLRRPNPYVNLQQVYRTGPLTSRPRIPAIYNFPHTLLQIDASDPKRAFLPEKHRSYSSTEGFIYPDDRSFEVSSKLSTVIQFKNQDFGMENCTLELTIPESSRTDFNPAVHIDHSSTIEVWMLDNSREISRYDLWDRAPQRQYLFDEISLDGKGTKESRLHYHCPSTTFSTFEFTCKVGNPHCLVKFWQRKSDTPNGIYIVQHDSLWSE
ncbi:hypothetical protein E1B28_004433 [Marasmius oreades]|uniref:Ubiquitin 3 binding protein But2 C-terminal domain-containing protein n=1 Tax=Marasmius oreades TaxID=181124 RepID=A0A9P7UYM2_9AGAR|nr:uncharacterized protein E1B28_004433 [Marasmius oreades]KAG7097042.1 hypothetical protein E1B28_004433 [Marasmius oreades]